MRSRSHNGFAGLRGAGEDQMIKLELRKRHTHATRLFKKRQFVCTEIAWGQIHQQAGDVPGVFRHLHHRTVACGKHIHQHHEAQVNRKVPRHDHAHHTQWLRHNAVLTAKKCHPICGATLRPHPLLEVFERMVYRLHHRHHFSQHGFMVRPVAVVSMDGLRNGVGVVAYKCFEIQQIRATLVRTGIRLCFVCCTLQLQGGVKISWQKRQFLSVRAPKSRRECRVCLHRC